MAPSLMTNLPDGEAVVGLVYFEGGLIVATTHGVFHSIDGVLHPIPFMWKETDKEKAPAGEDRG